MDGEPLFAGDSDLDQLYRIQTVSEAQLSEWNSCVASLAKQHCLNGIHAWFLLPSSIV
jgi:hypothetical protein